MWHFLISALFLSLFIEMLYLVQDNKKKRNALQIAVAENIKIIFNQSEKQNFKPATILKGGLEPYWLKYTESSQLG